MIFTVKEVRALQNKKQIINAFLIDHKLGVKDKLSATAIKQELIKFIQIQCRHPWTMSRPLFDLSSCKCPDCETILNANWENETAYCVNCGYEDIFENHGTFDDDQLDEFEDIEKYIYCDNCEWDGHRYRDPTTLVVEIVETEVEVW